MSHAIDFVLSLDITSYHLELIAAISELNQLNLRAKMACLSPCNHHLDIAYNLALVKYTLLCCIDNIYEVMTWLADFV